MTAKIGLIPGIISREIEADLFGTFERLAALGYHGVEGACVLAGDAADNRRRREALGLDALAGGIEWFVVEQDGPHRLSGWESVTASILNLRELGLV